MLSFDDPIQTATPSNTHSPKRISAADKRVINGTTDVNQLVPF